jgi:hypothetical protein
MHATIFNFTRRRVGGQHIVRAGILGSVLVATPEATALRACSVGVVVGRRGAEALLTLVMAAKEELEEDGD